MRRMIHAHMRRRIRANKESGPGIEADNPPQKTNITKISKRALDGGRARQDKKTKFMSYDVVKIWSDRGLLDIYIIDNIYKSHVFEPFIK